MSFNHLALTLYYGGEPLYLVLPSPFNYSPPFFHSLPVREGVRENESKDWRDRETSAVPAFFPSFCDLPVFRTIVVQIHQRLTAPFSGLVYF